MEVFITSPFSAIIIVSSDLDSLVKDEQSTDTVPLGSKVLSMLQRQASKEGAPLGKYVM